MRGLNADLMRAPGLEHDSSRVTCWPFQMEWASGFAESAEACPWDAALATRTTLVAWSFRRKWFPSWRSRTLVELPSTQPKGGSLAAAAPSSIGDSAPRCHDSRGVASSDGHRLRPKCLATQSIENRRPVVHHLVRSRALPARKDLPPIGSVRAHALAGTIFSEGPCDQCRAVARAASQGQASALQRSHSPTPSGKASR